VRPGQHLIGRCVQPPCKEHKLSALIAIVRPTTSMLSQCSSTEGAYGRWFSISVPHKRCDRLWKFLEIKRGMRGQAYQSGNCRTGLE
jgi:hypothetical protein